MAALFIELISKEFELTGEDITLMNKTSRQLSREDRRSYFGRLKRREKLFKDYLLQRYNSMDANERQKWVEAVVQSMLERGGEPDLSDSLVMGIVGRIPVYNRMRERSETEGIRLKALANFGGMSTVIILVMVITALVLYLTAE